MAMQDRQDWLREEILRIKQEKDVLILAHNYQIPEVQDIADFVGDSLELSLHAASTARARIVFCGVYFMAETARILSRKPVLMPVESAGCPLANMATAEALCKWKAEHPQAAVVAYINSSAAVKALSDIVCTSANALKIVQSVPQDEVIFLPDHGLGSWIE
jgi:quinolinate synthase